MLRRVMQRTSIFKPPTLFVPTLSGLLSHLRDGSALPAEFARIAPPPCTNVYLKEQYSYNFIILSTRRKKFIIYYKIQYFIRDKLGYNVYMTQVSREDVLHLAQLSSLELNENEIESLRNDLSNILGYIEQLSQLDTDGIEPTYQVSGLQNVWRSDEVIDYGVTREDLLACAPESQNNQLKVPKVL